MRNKNLVICFILGCILISFITNSYCQPESKHMSKKFVTIQGKITDKDTKAGISFASVMVKLNGKIITESTADRDGNYLFKIKPKEKG